MTQEQWISLGRKWKTTSSKMAVLYPMLEKFIGDFKGMTILDAGCGDGYWVRLCNQKGARCVGIDISPDSIKACKEKDPAGEYFVDDVKSLSVEGKFDYVLSILVLLSFDKLSEMKSAIKSMGSKLKPGGKLVIFTTHPAFDYVNDSMESMTREFKEKYSYSKKGLPTIYKHKLDNYNFTDFHWMIEDYVSCISKAGLVINNIFEPLPISESERENPQLYAARRDYPLYIAFVCSRN